MPESLGSVGNPPSPLPQAAGTPSCGRAPQPPHPTPGITEARIPFTGLPVNPRPWAPTASIPEHGRKRALRKEWAKGAAQWGLEASLACCPLSPLPLPVWMPWLRGHWGAFSWDVVLALGHFGLLLSFRALVRVSVCCRTNCTPSSTPRTLSYCLSEKPPSA